MKMKKLFLTLSALALMTAVPVQAASIERTMANINADANKSFADIAALKAKGESWDKIAEANNVSLGGKKNKKSEVKPVVKPTPTPPQKSLFQQQNDRYK